MAASVAWGLLLLLAVVGLLRAADHEDRQKLDAVNRRIQAMMDALQPAPDPTTPSRNRPDLRDWSHHIENVPEIAKSEGCLMAPVMTAFEQWLETVSALLEKRGIEPLDLDVGFYMNLYRDGLDPEQAVAEDACL